MADEFYVKERPQSWWSRNPFDHGVYNDEGALICIAQEHAAELVALALNTATTERK